MTEADGKPRARLALPYRRTPALICHRRNSTCPAWLSAASAPARCEPVPAPAATCTRYRRRPARGTSASAWNNAVRTRGVSTHRDDFQKPACAERGLVRTGTAPIISESAVIWTFRTITPATVGRKESPSVSSQQRPICSRLDRTFRRRCRLNSPACCSRQARYYRHFTCRRRLPLAARLTFLGSRDCSTQARPPAVADKTLTDRQIKVLPVRISGQVKPLIYSVPRCYPPPLVCRGCAHVGEGVSAFCPGKDAFRRTKGSGTHFVRRNAVTPDILLCIVAGIFANLGHDIMACMSHCGRRT